MSKVSIWLTAILLLVYYLFTSGLFYWASGSKESSRLITPFSWSLSAREQGLTPIAMKGDIDCIQWLIDNRNPDLAIACDSNGLFLSASWMGAYDKVAFLPFIRDIPQCYVFLTDWNVRNSKYTYCMDVGMREHMPYCIKKETNGDLRLYLVDFRDGHTSISLVKEVYRSGDSIIYEKLANVEAE